MNLVLLALVGATLILLVLYFKVIFTAVGAGSDHYVHNFLISYLRKNQRMPGKLDTFLNDTYLGYPVLLHKICSFLPKRAIVFLTNYLNILSQIVLWVFFLVFFTPLEGWLNKFLFIASCILMPFNYSRQNIKNFGLSARGVGILLFHLFYVPFCLPLSLEWQLGLSLICGVLIFYTSTFSAQALIMSSIILLVWTRWPLLSMIGSGLVFIALTPNYSSNYFIGKYWHLKMYATKHYKILVQNRPTIWKECLSFAWDFIRLKRKRIKYFLENPFLLILFSMPFAIPSVLSAFLKDDESFLLKLCISLFLVFVMTSFKRTRFLGEPERYVEIGYSFFILLALSNLPADFFYVILFFSFFLCCYQLRILKETLIRRVPKDDEYYEEISKICAGKRVVCDNQQVLKKILSPDMNVVGMWHTNTDVGGIPFEEYFVDNLYLKPTAIRKLIEKYSLNCFVFTREDSEKEILKKTDKLIYEKDGIKVFFREKAA